ncbi:MAG: SLC13 family permease, partial [Nodosilinea sp.]
MAYDSPQPRRWLNTFSTQGSSALIVALVLGIVGLIVVMPTLDLAPLPGPLTGAGWLTIGVTLAAFLLNALTPLPAEAIFLAALATLLLSGVLDTTTALAGF